MLASVSVFGGTPLICKFFCGAGRNLEREEPAFPAAKVAGLGKSSP